MLHHCSFAHSVSLPPPLPSPSNHLPLCVFLPAWLNLASFLSLLLWTLVIVGPFLATPILSSFPSLPSYSFFFSFFFISLPSPFPRYPSSFLPNSPLHHTLFCPSFLLLFLLFIFCSSLSPTLPPLPSILATPPSSTCYLLSIHFSFL